MTDVAFVLAGGLSTRMRSKRSKVLHVVAGRPLLAHLLETCALLDARPVVVLSSESEEARGLVPDSGSVVVQEPPRGTGHALQVALAATPEARGRAYIVYGDTVLVRAETLRQMAALLDERDAVLTILSGEGLASYGRIIRGHGGDVERIVEARVATPAERALPEANLGAYAVDLTWLRVAAARLVPNKTGEVFLTDVVALARAQGHRVAALRTEDTSEGLGVNTRADLARVERALRDRIRERHMLAGVTLRDPGSTDIDADVEIAADTVIDRGCMLEGRSRIGGDCRVGPYAIIRDSTVGDRCRVEASVIEGATLEDDVRIGPYSHLRPGAHLERGVEMGNFGEVKNARLRSKTKMHHFSYVGDADIGERVNIGAGTITLNYDGVRKHRTEVGDDAFIGSDTLLRAPIRVGKGAVTGAGAVVTKDVPDGMLAVGMPARAIKKAARKPRPAE